MLDATRALRVRKLPKQARSRSLVEALMQATARILVQDGWDALTTNRVAKEAGVSVGSLYQYFPDKDSLLAALVEGWADAMTEQFVALGPALETAPVEVCVQRVVATTLAVTNADARLHRAVMMQVPRIGALGFFEQLNRRAADVLAEWISLRRAELDVDDPSLTAHVIVTALDALTDHALLLRPELLESRRFAKELERLVTGCLRPKGHHAPSRPRRSGSRRSRSR